MSTPYSTPFPETPYLHDKNFLRWIFNEKINIYYVAFTIISSVIIWIIFKHFYPNPNIIFDSYYYVWAAAFKDNVSAWPIGYSKFLQLIGYFTHSVTLLILLQYVFLQLSFLYFFFSLIFIFKPQRWISWLILVFFIINPIYIYTCNLILSDTLFLGLSLLWLISLLWIIVRPQLWMLFVHALLLLITFSVRHSALYYPVIGVLGILLCRLPVKIKALGIFLQLLVVGGFMMITTYLNEREFGVKQFSPFQSWKVASNALYIYEHVPVKELQPVPKKFELLDSMVRAYYNSSHKPVNIFSPDASWGSYYMFMYPSPLLRYKDLFYPPDGLFLINVPTYSKMGSLYKDYGSWILKHYPEQYIKYFVIPNIYLYMLPYAEVYFDSYNPFNLQTDTIGRVTRKWFGIQTIKAKESSVTFRANFFDSYPMLNTCVHLMFILMMIGFVVLKGFQKIKRPYRLILLLISMLWIINFVFIVMASASLLRYQLFITVVEFVFSVIMWDLLYKEAR